MSPYNHQLVSQWCSKTTKLQDQDLLFFHDQDRSGQDHFFKTKTAFFKNHKLLTQNHLRSEKFWLGGAQIGNNFVTLFWWRFSVT